MTQGHQAGVTGQVVEASPGRTPQLLDVSQPLLPGLGLGDLVPLRVPHMDTQGRLRHMWVVRLWPGNQGPRLNKGPPLPPRKFRNKPAQDSLSCPICLFVCLLLVGAQPSPHMKGSDSGSRQCCGETSPAPHSHPTLLPRSDPSGALAVSPSFLFQGWSSSR